MADVHNKKTRSYNMSKISGKNTKPEILVRKYLHSEGFRFRLHDRKLPGKPDIVLRKYNTVVLINGCFWHGHENCKYFKVPKTRTDFWLNKINTNKERDKINKIKLEDLGWRVIEIWECELKADLKTKTLNNLVENLREKI